MAFLDISAVCLSDSSLLSITTPTLFLILCCFKTLAQGTKRCKIVVCEQEERSHQQHCKPVVSKGNNRIKTLV